MSDKANFPEIIKGLTSLISGYEQGLNSQGRYIDPRSARLAIVDTVATIAQLLGIDRQLEQNLSQLPPELKIQLEKIKSEYGEEAKALLERRLSAPPESE